MPTPTEGQTPTPEQNATVPPVQTPAAQAPITPEPTGDATNGKTPINVLPPDIQTYIEELRKEAAENRVAKKNAEKAAREAEEKHLAEQANWQKLAEQRAARLTELEPLSEQFDEIKAAFNAAIDSKLAQIPEDVRKAQVDPVRAVMTPVQFGKWLDAALPTLAQRQAPSLDAGAGGKAGKKPLGTADLKKVAY